ncbi:MAG TPA: PIN domain-containing protein [Chloroflexota bacterium]|nr:PIN domain-containing protein [Chloroflexota bacterium]
MIFVDTSFWAGLRGRRDNRHDAAIQAWRKFGRERLVTSNLVRGETWTLLRRKAGFRVAVDFLDTVEASLAVAVLQIEADIEETALAWLREHDEREYSYVDATSFMLMQSLRIREALAFDGDFSAAGFVELRA